MLKQHINRITKVVTILLAVFLVASLTAGAASAIGSLPAKAAIMQQYFTCENNQVKPYWIYAENINDGRGITLGFIGFTTGTYDANILIHHYTVMNPNNVLAKYIPALDAIDAGPHNSDADHDGNPSVVGLNGFIQDINGINDPLWAQAQMWLFNSMYWDIAVGQANSIGAQYEVTLGVIFDANGRHGEDGAKSLIDQTTAAMGGTPATGVNEIAWLNKFIAIRDVKLKSENLGDQDRQNGYKEDIAAGNYNLVTPYVIHTYGDPYTIDGILGVDLGGGVGLGTGGKSPVASFTSVATGLSVQFTDKSSNTPISWSWIFGDGSTLTAENSKQNPSHLYTVAGTYQVTLTATNSAGSSSPVTKNVIVTAPIVKPVSDFSSVATGPSVQFTDKSSNTPTSWSWIFGDGSTLTAENSKQNPSHLYTAGGTYQVKLTATNAGGSNSITIPITVNVPVAKPVPAFTYSPTSGITASTTVTFTDTSSNNPTTSSWVFGDGGTATGAKITHKFTKSGSISVQLTTSNGGGSATLNKTISVAAVIPVASFSYSPTTVRRGNVVTFTDSSTNYPTSWKWTFSDTGTTVTTTTGKTTHTFSRVGTYTVKLVSYNSAGSSQPVSKSITVSF